MKKVDFMMKFLLFINFFKSISKPMTKSRKYIPNWARNSNVVEEVIAWKGL